MGAASIVADRVEIPRRDAVDQIVHSEVSGHPATKTGHKHTISYSRVCELWG